MKSLDTRVDRDIFCERIQDTIQEYLVNSPLDLENDVLAIKTESLELMVCHKGNQDFSWDSYPISSLLRDCGIESGKEVDIDEAFIIASGYFFVR